MNANMNVNVNEIKMELGTKIKTTAKFAAAIMMETKNLIVSKLRRNPKAVRIGSVVLAAGAAVAWIMRFVIHAEMTRIQDSYATLVIVGAEQMSRAEYLEYASGLISNCTVIGIVLLAAAALLFVCVYKKKH